MNETQPTTPKKSRSFVTLAVVGLAFLIVALGIVLGVNSAINARKAQAQEQVRQALSQQFELGVQDLAEGRYDIARQRFEYVLKNDPTYPGAQDNLTEAMLKLNATPTPTPSPTPDLSTPDLRGAEELFTQANAKLVASDWDGAQETLDTLRKGYPDYKVAVVDGMYYILLRNRGVDKITAQRNLEGGIYDLTLAERFGPLDNISGGLRNFSRIYLTGASFWEVDWKQAVFVFAQVAPYLPGLTDGSGMSAKDRYGFAAVKYGEQLIAAGQACEAKDMLAEVITFVTNDDLAKVVEEAESECASQQQSGASTFTPTPSPTGGTPVITTTEVAPVVTTEVPPPPSDTPPPPTDTPPPPTDTPGG